MEKEFVKNLDSIFILGRGNSLLRCPVKKPEKAEYWGCNSVYKAREIDRLFIMRNLYVTQFNKDKEILKNINEKDFPVYTLGEYREIKNNIRYPMEEMIKEYGIAHFLTSISYMLALAISQKPKNLFLLGIDMEFGVKIEYLRDEKGCIEYWLGVAVGRGININLAQESTLMRRKKRNNFYGLIVKKGENKESPSTVLEPQYLWGKPKSALKYKIVKMGINI